MEGEAPVVSRAAGLILPPPPEALVLFRPEHASASCEHCPRVFSFETLHPAGTGGRDQAFYDEAAKRAWTAQVTLSGRLVFTCNYCQKETACPSSSTVVSKK